MEELYFFSQCRKDFWTLAFQLGMQQGNRKDFEVQFFKSLTTNRDMCHLKVLQTYSIAFMSSEYVIMMTIVPFGALFLLPSYSPQNELHSNLLYYALTYSL